MYKTFFSLIYVFFLSFPLYISAEMTGGDFEIYADVFSTIEEHAMDGGDYSLYSTAGESGADMPTGGDYILRAGFQAMERDTVSLSLSNNTLNLGTITPTAIASTTLTCTASTDYLSGYNITIKEDTNLQTADGHNIDDVADGTVTIGSEEYGVKTSGVAGQYNATDTSITDSTKIIVLHASSISNQDTDIIFRASADQTQTRQGAYSHTITLTATTNL